MEKGDSKNCKDFFFLFVYTSNSSDWDGVPMEDKTSTKSGDNESDNGSIILKPSSEIFPNET